MERTQNLAKYLSKILQKHQLFAKSEKPFTIFGKISIMHFWQGSGCASELASKVKDVSFLNPFKYQR